MVFLKVIKSIKAQEKELRILILGLDNAGKTTVVKQFSGESVQEVAPTLGFQIKTLHYEGYRLNIWDVGGQKSIRPFWTNYFEDTDGLIWVVDCADVTRLEDCRIELMKLLKEERLAGAGLLIFANKTDLLKSFDKDVISHNLDLHHISSHRWHIEGCSALTGEGLEKGMRWLVDEIGCRVG